MTVMAVLAGLALVSFSGARVSSRDGKRKADLEQIKSALEMYRADNPGIGYPAATGNANNVLLCGACPLNGYMAAANDPLSTQGQYYYYTSGGGASFTLCARLEGSSGSCSGNPPCGTAICNYQLGP